MKEKRNRLANSLVKIQASIIKPLRLFRKCHWENTNVERKRCTRDVATSHIYI